MVELEAKRRGLMEADTVAVVGDGGDFVWRTAREVCAGRRARGKRVFEVLDIIHAGEHLTEAARAAFGTTEDGAAWLNARNYFDTHRDRIRYDTFRRHGLPLASCNIESGLPVRQDRPARRADRTSGNQANRRVHEGQLRRRGSHRSWKGSEKQWLLSNAEAMLALRCLALSQDGRWNGHFDALRRGPIEVSTPGRVRAARDRTESASRHEQAA